jgi:hypothetical protein
MKRFKSKEEALSWLKLHDFWHYQSSPTCDWYAKGDGSYWYLEIYALKKTAKGFTLRKSHV